MSCRHIPAIVTISAAFLVSSASAQLDTATWGYSCPSDSTKFGSGLSSAGDVNGDGYTDLIVGAPGFSGNGYKNAGAVYVFYGGPNGFHSTPDWSFTNDSAGSQIGHVVAFCGDVNGDGYGDVLVGAPAMPLHGASGWIPNCGKVYLFYGSASGLHAAPGWSAFRDPGSTFGSGQQFGLGVFGLGDINGDGFSDFAVNSVGDTLGNYAMGVIYLYLGSPGGPSLTPDTIMVGPVTDAALNVISAAGDINGDGYADFLAQRYDPSAYTWHILVYFGGPSGISGSPQDWLTHPNTVINSFSWVGDVNGDGYSDVALGDPAYGASHAGHVQVYYGGPSGLSTTPGWEYVFPSGWTNYNMGAGVYPLGDVNGDGYADFAVRGLGFAQAGAVACFLGKAGKPDSAIAFSLLHQSSTGDGYGYVAPVGDVNGDGVSDFAVSQPYDGGTSKGSIYLYSGKLGTTRPDTLADWSVEVNQDAAKLGTIVTGAGDLNGDGFADVLAQAQSYNDGVTTGKKVFAYLGGPGGLSTTASWSATGGSAVAAVGDINGDGYPDVVIGDSSYANGQAREGCLVEYWGGPGGLSSTPHKRIEANVANAVLGGQVHPAGDVDGDGFADVIVTSAGAVRLYRGSDTGLVSTPAWVDSGWQYDFAVGGIGDVNGDGYSDIMHWSGADTILIFYGGPAGLPATPSMKINAYCQSIAYAGDLNGDGYSDVAIVAATGVWVMYGSSTGLVAPVQLTVPGLTGTPTVSAAGDVNNDGYDDLLVGVPAYNGNRGTIYAFLGGRNGVSLTSAWQAKIAQAGATLGASVACAGDINGDGFADILAGAPGVTNGNTGEGRIVAYYGAGGAPKAYCRGFQTNATTPLVPGSYTTTAGQMNVSQYARSFEGRRSGRIGWEFEESGRAFSGLQTGGGPGITGEQSVSSDLGLGGAEIKQLVTNLNQDRSYRWRSRLHFYQPASLTGQVYSPWHMMSRAMAFDEAVKSGDRSAPPPPSLTGPADGATGLVPPVVLTWTSVNGAGAYRVQASRDSTFGTVVVDTQISSGTQCAWLCDGASKFFWRVASVNYNGSGAYSSRRSFSTKMLPPKLMLPVNGATRLSPTSPPTLAWHASVGAGPYGIELDTVRSFTSAQAFSTTGDSTLALPYGALAYKTVYYWRVKARNWTGTDSSAFSPYDSFTTAPDKPGITYLVSPADNSTGVGLTPTLRWHVTPDAETYELVVAPGSNWVSPTVDTFVNGDTLVTLTSTLAYGTNYGWRVRASNITGVSDYFSAPWGFTTIPPAPPAPVLTSPANGATGVGLSPQFAWDSAAYAVTYNLQAALDSNFTSVVVDAHAIGVRTYTASGLSHNTRYYWHVCAANGTGTGVWSSRASFVTLPGANNIPVLVAPALGASNVALRDTLRWRPVSGAISYQVQVGPDSAFGTPVINDSALTDTTQALGGLANFSQYWWHVRAVMAGGPTPWCAAWSFTTVISAPAAPVTVSPASAAVDIPTNTVLVWRSSARASSYRLQVSLHADFSVLDRDTIGLSDTTFALSALRADSVYHWRVQAANVGGTSAWSDTSLFTTLIALPDTVVLVAPGDGDTVKTLATSFIWRSAAPAVSGYRLQIATDSAFGHVVVDSLRPDTSLALGGLADSTVYWWRAQAQNHAGWGAFAVQRKLVIRRQTTLTLPRQLSANFASVAAGRGVIRLALPARSSVSLRVYTLSGECLWRYDAVLDAGYHNVALGAQPLHNGTFVMRLAADRLTLTRAFEVVR